MPRFKARNFPIPVSALTILAIILATAPRLFAETASEQANAFFERAFNERVERDPMRQAELGIKDDYDKWNDLSDAYAQETATIIRRQLDELRETIVYDDLDPATRLSYDLFAIDCERRLERFKWRFHTYPINQMRGWQSQIPAFLISYHTVSSVSDAEAYISRIQGIGPLIDQVIMELDTRAGKGVIAPAFVFPRAINDSENVISGRPFDDSDDDSVILADFRKKTGDLDIDEKEEADLLRRAELALTRHVGPAYQKLIRELETLQTRAPTTHGAWTLPDGEAFYSFRLWDMTTTDLTADEIHQTGLDDVARIHDEMRAIMKTVGFEGSLQEFFVFTRDDPQFYYPNNDGGKQAYLEGAVSIIENMNARLDEMFAMKPQTPIVVKRVEAFREKSTGGAFYQRPSADGTRPGTYYVNLYDMASRSIFQMEALAYHEGIPGHHMQIALAMETEGLASFRKYSWDTAYGEGWALYSEYVPKEFGFYEDPYSDYGRLGMELWRACRLVVDTGLHARRWTRERAIEYLEVNTPQPRDNAVKAIDRYIVMPGQATAYKIGMIRILELRADARERLGDKFDIREFHDVILANGPVTLQVLAHLVDDWVVSQGGKKTSRR